MEKFLAANLVIFYTTSGGELYYGATVDDVVDALNDKAQAWKFELSSGTRGWHGIQYTDNIIYGIQYSV